MVSFHVISFSTMTEELRGTIKVLTAYFILPSKQRGLMEKFFPQSITLYLGRRQKKSKKMSVLLSLKNVPIHLKWLLCYLVLKVNRYTCKGSNSFHFHICVPSYQESTLKEKNLLLYEQILSCKSRPHFERLHLSRDANRKLQRLFPLTKTLKKVEVFAYTAHALNVL